MVASLHHFSNDLDLNPCLSICFQENLNIQTVLSATLIWIWGGGRGCSREAPGEVPQSHPADGEFWEAYCTLLRRRASPWQWRHWQCTLCWFSLFISLITLLIFAFWDRSQMNYQHPSLWLGLLFSEETNLRQKALWERRCEMNWNIHYGLRECAESTPGRKRKWPKAGRWNWLEHFLLALMEGSWW